MAGRIPRSFIDDLINRVDIVDVISSRIQLKKAGKDYQACCPFHQEKTPSFTVSRDKQFYHCFGCDAHGTAIGFLMEYDNLGFVDAVTELAGQLGIEVPRDSDDQPGPDHEPVYAVLEAAADFYRHQLRSHPEASRAVDYLKRRGMTGEVAARFSIGYAPPGWENLLQHLGTDEQTIQLLSRAGLLSQGDTGKVYDRFRDRIMFPIRDHRGRTLGFGGRLLGDGTPKYMNSPESDLFHKSTLLYGLFEARKAIRRLRRLIVVEGYMDVVALVQFGIADSVATLGTATTAQHLEILFRTVSEVVFCFDGDKAGREAAWKALNTALPSMREGREVRFLFLPEGEDPDSLVRKIKIDGFEELIDKASPFSTFFFERLTSEVDMSNLDGRAHLGQLARPLLDRLPRGIYRDMMFARLSELLGLPKDRLESAPARNHQHPPNRYRREHGIRMTPVRRAIALLLQHPHLAKKGNDVSSDWTRLETPGIALLRQLLEFGRTTPNLTTAALLEHWRDTEEGRYMGRLAAAPLTVPEEGLTDEFCGALDLLNEQFRRGEKERLLAKTSPTQMTDEEKQRLKGLFAAQFKDPEKAP